MSDLLVGRTVPVAGLRFELQDAARIGAGLDAEFCVLAPDVSDVHAKVWRDGDLIWLEDLGSAHGTFLNGERVAHRELLQHLDVISLGRYVDLIYLCRRAAPAAT